MRDVVNQIVLVLNHSYEPISLAQARRAIALVVKERAHTVEHNGTEVYPGIMFPVVIRLANFTRIPYRTKSLSRENIFKRDRKQCLYCLTSLKGKAYTLDHVVPRSRGGQSVWENLVTCCSPCNRKKADRSLEDCGMTLARRPRPATIHTNRFILRSMAEGESQWEKYLFFDSAESENVTREVA
jgi:5-methylcytosine-specific restriction endonuclease McrA